MATDTVEEDTTTPDITTTTTTSTAPQEKANADANAAGICSEVGATKIIQSNKTKNSSPLGFVVQRARQYRFRLWHLLVVLGAGVVAMVLALVLVHVREHKISVNKTQLPINASESDLNLARINLGYAQYQGTPLANGINEYLGMRFAAPPLGDLRWRAPAPPVQVLEEQPANAFGKICLGISAVLPSDNQGEDCLFANVWAPRNATVDSKLPVWLFIQGGGYTVNSNANWNGSEVAFRSGLNMVMVNFNYRVGMWGFLASERMRANGDLNVGLLDQRMMMQWVQKYIAQFGGDPNNVIIHGASAGAGSVALHLVANGGLNQNLFHGAIAESVFFPSQPPVAKLEWQFDRFMEQTGCAGSGDPMVCLRNLDEVQLQAANVPTPFPTRTESPLPLFYWTPCIDGDFLVDLPYTSFVKGAFVKVPVIFGTGSNEGSYFAINAATPDDVANFFQNNYPLLTEADTTNIVTIYPQMPPLPFHDAWYPSASMAYGEATFICPQINILNMFLQSAPGVPVWGYRYNVIDGNNTAIGLGVPHLFESWAVFGPDSINGPNGGPSSYYTYNAPIVPITMDYWISFVMTLNPNTRKNPDAPQWELWSPNKVRLKFETGSTMMEVTSADQLQRCEMWQRMAPVTEQK